MMDQIINSAVYVKLLSEPNSSEMGLTSPDKEKNLGGNQTHDLRI